MGQGVRRAERSTEWSAGYAYYVLIVLSLAYVLNFIDRSILAILLEPIKRDLKASDTEMGLLSGFAFSFVYSLLSMPIAFLADRTNRRNVLMIGIAFWSAMTSLCGLSRNYAELFVGRMFVGVGEAAGASPAYALLADYFPPARRPWVMSIYSCSIFIGIMLSLAGGGIVAEHLGWRAAFLVLGPPGIALALLVAFTVKEPLRGRFDAHDPSGKSGVGETLRFLSHQTNYLVAVFGLTAMSVALGSFAAWAPTVLIRAHNMSMAMVGLTFGVILGVGGVVGALTGGMMATRFGSGRPRVAALFPGIACLGSAPFFIAFCLLHSSTLALIMYLAAVVTSSMHFGPAFALVQNAIPARMRSVAASLSLLLTTIAGSGLGPLLTGWLSDRLTPVYGSQAIRYALLGSIVFTVLAFALFLRLARSKNLAMASAG